MEQRAASHYSYTATSLGAFIDSFFRSAMNALINQRLTGQPQAWFPNMHIQAPTRVLYINALKRIRAQLQEVDVAGSPYPNIYRLCLSFVPGLIVCPMSSVLEACNATANPESLVTRWTRGYVPRCGREVVFGIGINQLSEWCIERSSFLGHLRVPVGSIFAGVVSGYLSHVPHNLSTLKLLEPSKSYAVHWHTLWQKSIPQVPTWVPPVNRDLAAKFMAVFLPVGVVRRSLQISGSFIVINGTIGFFKDLP